MRFLARTTWLLILATLTAQSAAAAWVPAASVVPEPAAFAVVSSTPDAVVLRFDLAGFDLTTIPVDGRPSSGLTLPGTVHRREAGCPEVPMLSTSVRLPATGAAVLRVLERRERELALPAPTPSLGHLTRDLDPADRVPVFGPAYAAGVWPLNEVELGRPFLLGGSRGVGLRLNPLRWDADRGVLLVTESITVEIAVTAAPGHNELRQEAAPADRFAAWTAGLFVNAPPAADKALAPAPRERLLIVSHDDFLTVLAPFVEWKRQRGLDVEVLPLSAVGGTAAGIGAAVAERFAAPAGLTYLILVGDVEQVPTNAGTYEGADSDVMYALAAGDDLYPDLFVSRVSARTPLEVQVQLNKFIAYERDADPGDGWFDRAAGVAGSEGTPADSERADWLRSDLLGYDFSVVDRLYQDQGGTTAGIRDALQAGRSLVNYLGHGTGTGWTSVPFDNADVGALANDGRLPWIIDVSCSNGDFSRGECFAEAWLRAGTVAAGRGAIGMLAASSLAPWTPPTLMQAEIIDQLTAETASSLGALTAAGLLKVAQVYDGLPVAAQVIEQYNLFGDCSLVVRTRTPQTVTVGHPDLLSFKAAQVTIEVPGHPGAVAALTAGGRLLGSATVDGAGLAVITLEAAPAAGERVELTVSGYNLVPYRAPLTVAAETTPVTLGPAAAVRLHGNYPNPFNPVTTLAFTLPGESALRVVIHDLRGAVVRVLETGVRPAGRVELRWDGRDGGGRPAPSGVYLYRVETAHGAGTGRMILAK